MMFKNLLAITTPSLGLHPSHTLPEKIKAAASSGFSFIEILYQELVDHGLSQAPPLSTHEAARSIGELCSSANLKVLALNPFKNFEGHNSPISERLDSARHWIELASCLGAKYLQVPSQFDTANSSPDWDLMVQELRQLSELAASHSISIAYEAVAWGSYVDTWEGSLRMVEDVDRSNFGVCLDSFHIAARVWGDCSTVSGICRDGESDLNASLDLFVEICPLDKIFYVQFSDAERFVPPLTPEHRFYQATSPSSLIWSRNMRLFPFEKELGAYFPVLEIVDAWLKRKEWKGVVSMEIFDWRMREDASRQPNENAKRGMESWNKLVAALESSSRTTSNELFI
jgi:sugar phosphate isomerase/epimerase